MRQKQHVCFLRPYWSPDVFSFPAVFHAYVRLRFVVFQTVRLVFLHISWWICSFSWIFKPNQFVDVILRRSRPPLAQNSCSKRKCRRTYYAYKVPKWVGQTTITGAQVGRRLVRWHILLNPGFSRFSWGILYIGKVSRMVRLIYSSRSIQNQQ